MLRSLIDTLLTEKPLHTNKTTSSTLLADGIPENPTQ